MRRTLVVLLSISIVGCNQASPPDASEKPRQKNTPAVRQSEPTVIVTRPTPPDAIPKQQVAPDPVQIDAAPTVKLAKSEVPDRPKAAQPEVMDAARAIKIAEQFVRDNGYTDFVPPDASKLVSESIEREGREQWIADRHNTLRPRALGYIERGRTHQSSGWLVGFEHVEASARGLGRAVTMDASGRGIRMEHKDLPLENLTPRPDEESK